MKKLLVVFIILVTVFTIFNISNVYASARWDGTKYVSTSVNEELGIVFLTTDESGNEIEQGFRLLNLPIKSTDNIYLIESNVSVSGYICELTNHDSHNTYGRWMAFTFSGLDNFLKKLINWSL